MDLNANFLLGRGEKLTSTVDVPAGGGNKNPPYTFEQAVLRLAPEVSSTSATFGALPNGACPDDDAVAVMTLHPRYVSKSDHPSRLLREVGLRSIGSRPTKVKPEQWGIKKPPLEAVTTDLFVAGTRKAFDLWSSRLPGWGVEHGHDQLVKVERIRPHISSERMRSIPEGSEEHLFEVVLHTGRKASIIDAFAEYARSLGASPDLDRRREIQGLCFVPMKAPCELISSLAEFTMMRAVRGMPKLRPLLRPGVLRRMNGFNVILPDIPASEGCPWIAVFDGGLPDDAGLERWVTHIDAAGVGAPVPDFQEHGLQVTSALLFGPLDAHVPPEQPYCNIDHYRVLGQDIHNETEDLYDVLARVTGVLATHRHRYQFVNLSIGPDLAVEDDDVHVWTATLDAEFARADVLTVVAVGNNGELDSATGLDRIQPPADAINVLAVGACDSEGEHWARAAYSSKGPGRSPGVVKPDGLAFGGSPAEPFYALAKGGRALPTQGTSFAAPTVLRTAGAVRALLGPDLSPLALRALLVHRAGRSDQSPPDVGWGRFITEPLSLVTSSDYEVHIVYQGQLPVGTYLRAPIPLPPDEIAGMVELSATLCIAPEVDPEHAVTYSRAGVEIRFRPHCDKYKFDSETGEVAAHPKTDIFFSQKNLYPNEFILRDDGHKWEPVLFASRRKRGSSLKEPRFDIYCHQREAGEAATQQPELPYALVVTVSAPKVQDLYNQVVRAYRVLQPLRPVARIQVRT